MTTDKLPGNFLDVFNLKETILFIGAGISTWSGAPTWRELLYKFIGFLKYKGLCSESERKEIELSIANNDLLVAASLCKSLVNNADFSEFINKEFVEKNFAPAKLHNIIVNLGPNSYITTNYDNLIENAFQHSNNGLSLKIVNNDQPIEQATIQKHSITKFIYKLHGTMYNPGSIILTHEDYRNLRINMVSAMETLKHLLIQRPVVYLGFGLKDPTFLLIKDFIAETFKGGNRQHFAIMPNVSELQKKFWYQSHGISLISYQTFEKQRSDGKHYTSHDEFYKLLEAIPRSDNFNYSEINSITSAQTYLTLLRYCDSISYEFQRKSINVYDLFGRIKDVEKNVQSTTISRHQKGRFVAMQEVLANFSKLIVIGPPGSGKTTSLEYFSFKLANETRNINGAFPKCSIPIILQFKEYNGSVMEMLSSKLPKDFDKESALKSGLFSIILDAVNEAPKEYFEKHLLKDDLASFIKMYPENRFILSSRTESYVQFLDFPIYTIDALHPDVIAAELAKRNIEIKEMSYSFLNKLRNPFLFKLFVDSELTNLQELRGPFSLLEKYFQRVEKKLAAAGFRVKLAEVFSAVGYELVETGKITSGPEMYLTAIRMAKIEPDLDFLNQLIALKFLVPDTEGNVGFIHQTILEFLAATHLARDFEPGALEKIMVKMQSSRWDETLILFISLLAPEHRSIMISKILEKDIFFAFYIYNSATFENAEIKDSLFEEFFERLGDKSINRTKKISLGNILYNTNPSGKFIGQLKSLVQDGDIGDKMALALARLKVPESIDEIIDGLFLRNNSYPNGYARALVRYEYPEVATRVLSRLIQLDSNDHSELLFANAAIVILNYFSPEIGEQVKSLAFSDKLAHKQISAKLLEGILDPYASAIALKLLEENDSEIIHKTVSGLRERGWIGKRPIIQNAEIVDLAFSKLKDAKLGSAFAEYLSEVKIHNVEARALERLKSSTDAVERINLAKIVFDVEREEACNIGREYLKNYKSEYGTSLRKLIFLNEEYFINEAASVLNARYAEAEKFVLNSFNNDLEGLAPLVEETCVNSLLKDWQECLLQGPKDDEWYIWAIAVPKLIGYSPYFKKELLAKFNDPNYKHRYQILNILFYKDIDRIEVKPETLEWLLTRMTQEAGPFTKNATEFIGKVADEKFARESLVPLLNSHNLDLRDNAYSAIISVERRINKRLVDK